MHTLTFRMYTLRAIAAALVVFSSMALGEEHIFKPTEEGQQLLAAIINEDDRAFEQAIAEGADPNEIPGKYDTDWSMCVATQPGKERFLRQLLDLGANPDLFNAHDHSTEAPTTCSMVNGNLKAFDILIAAGADPGRIACSGCPPGGQSSLFRLALNFGNFDIAVRLLDIVEPSLEDMLYTKNEIESPTTYQSSLTQAMAAYLKARGITVTPPSTTE